MRWLFMTLLLVGAPACYSPPTSATACTILCTDACPGDMACVNGMCAAPGDTCTPTFRTVRAGNGFACALDEQDLLWCWGSNARHQITPDDVATLPYATRIGSDRWDTIATGGHVCALRDGALSCWGPNTRGQVSGTITGDVSAPIEIPSPQGAPWSMVVAGYDETCGITDGRLYCWGANESGQLGVGDLLDRATPTPVMPTITDWTLVAIANTHGCAVSATAGLHCWGANDYGQVGDGLQTATRVTTPVPVALTNVSSLGVLSRATCAVADGKLHCWGYAPDGALGDPANIDPALGNKAVPTLASGLDGWSTVSGSHEAACGLRNDEVWCWGRTRGGGGVGNGVWSSNRSWGGRILGGASEVSLGWNANFDDADDAGTLTDSRNLDLGCAIADGSVRCWGDNRFGQLGQGAATMQPAPTPVSGDHVFSTIAAGGNHACGLEAGALLCWGTTINGEANGIASGTSAVPCGSIPNLACNRDVPTPVPDHPTATSIALGANHTCILDGTDVTCWGDNDWGQLGSPEVEPAPRRVPGAFATLFSGGHVAQCTRTTTGEAQCWGGYMGAVISTPTHVAELDAMTAIGISSSGINNQAFGCILDQNQQLSCYGSNALGQFGNGSTGVCGDLVCNITESTALCPGDCPTAQTTCGNTKCDHGETSSTCPADCGSGTLTRLRRSYHEISVSRGSTNYGGLVCGIRLDRTLECWGRNREGSASAIDLGTGTLPDYVHDPVLVPGLEGCTSVSVASSNACALCNGQISCWGDNRRGALGAGFTTPTPVVVPQPIALTLPDGEAWVQIVTGSGFACARTDLGHAYCWGISTQGALGNGAASANLPVTVQLLPVR